ncbi:MAG: hypothetical protein ACTSUY_01405, partial [Alphaproteobacteria bacterium]
MTWADWIPALSTSTLLAVLGFVVGTYYKARVESAIKSKFDLKLEELKSKLRSAEETIKAKILEKDEQIAALRGGALSEMANRHTALDKRRLDAIEMLWVAVVGYGQTKFLSRMLAPIKMEYAIDAAAKQDEDGKKIRDFADVLWNISGIDKFKPIEPPDRERPFLPPIIWALFSAYRRVLS